MGHIHSAGGTEEMTHVPRQLIPIENGHFDVEARLVTLDVEKHFRIPRGVERVSDDSRSEHLFAE